MKVLEGEVAIAPSVEANSLVLVMPTRVVDC